LTVLAWRIYYDGGGTFSNEDGPPDRAPGWGAVVIPQADPDVGRMMMSRWDHYCWHEGQWWGHDLVGLMDCLARPGPSVVVHGRTVPQAAWRAIYNTALTDPDLPTKSAAMNGEHRGGDA